MATHVYSDGRSTPPGQRKLQADVASRGLGLLVAADWFDPSLMRRLSYTNLQIGQYSAACNLRVVDAKFKIC